MSAATLDGAWFGTAPARHDPSVPRPPAIEPDPTPPSEPASASWGTVALTALGALLYCVGWVAGSIWIPLGAAARWVFAAVATGWDDASTSWHRPGRMWP